MREHQTPNYVTDLREYFDDIDAAWGRITERDGHDHVVATAHSTGGLTLPLWADDRRPAARRRGAELPVARPAGLGPDAHRRHRGASRRSAARQPMRPIPRKVTGLLRPQPAPRPRAASWTSTSTGSRSSRWPVYAGWLRAVRTRPRRAAPRPRGAAAPCWCSPPAPPPTRPRWATTCTGNDIVLDVEQIRRWATALGRHVTYIGVDGALTTWCCPRPDGPGARVRRARPLARRPTSRPSDHGSASRDDQRGHADDHDDGPQHERRAAGDRRRRPI